MPLIANSQGQITGSFDIPPNVPTGSKNVRFVGSGGSRGDALYVANGVIETRTFRNTITTIFWRGVDPLAQTFLLSEDRIVGGVDLKFCARGDVKKPVFVQIRETEAGVPSSEIVCEAVLEPDDIILPSVGVQSPSFDINNLPNGMTWLYDQAPNTKYANDARLRILAGSAGNNKARALLRFSLPDNMAGAVVDSAVLRLTKANGIGDDQYQIAVRKMTQAWNNDATWNKASSDTPWTAQGGTYATAGTDPKATFPAGNNHTVDFNVKDIAQAWASGDPNFGLLLQAFVEGQNAGGWVELSKTVSPRLIVTYRVPSYAGTPNNGWTRVQFAPPIPLTANKYYALVLLTDDAQHAVSIATLGDYVRAGSGADEGWVTAQPFQIGELLSSSNAHSWTPHPKSDLTFRLLGCKFTANTHTVDFGDIGVVNASDMIVQAGVERPSGDVDVNFESRFQGFPGEVLRSDEDQPIELNEFRTDTVNIKAVLEGTEKMSPIIFPNMQALVGTVGTTGDYQSRAIQADEDFDVQVIFEAFKPSSANVVPQMERQQLSGGNPVIDGNGVYVGEYVGMTRFDIKRMSDGWIEETWKVENLRGVGLDLVTRVKLLMTGAPNARIRVRNLRVIIK